MNRQVAPPGLLARPLLPTPTPTPTPALAAQPLSYPLQPPVISQAATLRLWALVCAGQNATNDSCVFNFCQNRRPMRVPAWPGTSSAGGKQRLFLWHANRRILTDTRLLTCHFLFEQKQVSLQTPCSSGLWVLLLGRDLFTQPRDKVGLLVHPEATITTTTFPSRAPPRPPPTVLPSASSSPH